MKCQATTNSGKQCSREAEEGSKFCWQHQPEVEDVGGRRPKFETAAKMQKAIDEYFDSCFIEAQTDDGKTYQKQIRPFTVTGLAYHLGMTRKGLLDYEAKNEEFCNTITHAKTRIEMYAEEQLFRKKGSTHGVEFNLINNFKNWNRKQQIDMNSTTENISDLSKEEREKRRQELREKFGDN